MSIEPSPLLEVEPASSSEHFEQRSGKASRLAHSRTTVAIGSPRLETKQRESHRRELSPALREKIKELIQLAREQGYLTREDVHETLSGEDHALEDLDEVYRRLRSLEIEVSEVPTNRVKERVKDEEEQEETVEALDDPVRMYLKEMGQVKLLTREQEVEISKRIEEAELEIKDII